ncbi:expressed unknown protein [Seminavis robusta]|uniref:Uncharacterized protein n=1 Tax=Seminavis robusta TaxID=568900 RepID=A0A9N8EK97_9STRA|nr:expressed unknown protein [Seminavis robusta]|eukprot:Sro1099_g241160.1 n/a (146) ;mRNA; r:27196-27832
MFSSTKLSLLSVAFSVIAALNAADAFAPQARIENRPMTQLHAENPTTSRRAAVFGIMGVVGSTLVGNPEEASARYSSYAHREQDWQERSSAGQVNFKTAKDLRKELQEIAPMNSSRSKIFCPNGTSAAVSPLVSLEDQNFFREAM